jgi:hypothetical protein
MITHVKPERKGRKHPGERVPAEVSKRGVMIGILRGPSPAGKREPY